MSKWYVEEENDRGQCTYVVKMDVTPFRPYVMYRSSDKYKAIRECDIMNAPPPPPPITRIIYPPESVPK